MAKINFSAIAKTFGRGLKERSPEREPVGHPDTGRRNAEDQNRDYPVHRLGKAG